MSTYDNRDVLLSVDGLAVHYNNFQALADVSIEVREGSIVSLIGSNGAGKSTLLNTIMGINKPTSGKIVFNGEEIQGLATNKIVAKGICLSPEGSQIFEKLSVEENLLVGAYLPNARKNIAKSMEKVLSLFPMLKEKLEQNANLLSGGQRQMLAIGRAIMSMPKVLICDEISLGLAPVIIKDIYVTLEKINKEGVTIILVEQDMKRSLKYSDYSYVILKGEVVLQGKSSELPEDEVSDAYFGLDKYSGAGSGSKG